MRYIFISFFLIIAFSMFLLPSSAEALCTDDSTLNASGTYTLASNCSFSGTGGVNGVENGDLVVPGSFTLTINADETVVWNSGQSVTVNGTIMKSASGATLQKTNLWVLDADSDGAATGTQVASDSSPGGGYRRRNTLNDYSARDVNDGDANCYQDLSCYSQAACGVSGPATECAAATCDATPGLNSTGNVPTYYVFVTSGTYASTAIVNGATADGICESVASGNATGTSYTAWISDDANTDEPADRGLSTCAALGAGSAEWRLVNGSTVVANNWNDLVDGSIDAAINLDQTGASRGTIGVWTGTNDDGTYGTTASNDNCSGWSTAAGNNDGIIGSTNSTSATWSDDGGNSQKCNADLPIYCFQDS